MELPEHREQEANYWTLSPQRILVPVQYSKEQISSVVSFIHSSGYTTQYEKTQHEKSTLIELEVDCPVEGEESWLFIRIVTDTSDSGGEFRISGQCTSNGEISTTSKENLRSVREHFRNEIRERLTTQDSD